MHTLRARLLAWIERNILGPAPANPADGLGYLDRWDGRRG